MSYLPIDKDKYTILPFCTYLNKNLSELSSGVEFYTLSTTSIGTESGMYGSIANIYGVGNATVFNQQNTYFPNSIRLIDISNKLYGDEIVPGTFSVADNFWAPMVTNLIDDGNGNLWDYNIKGTQYGGHYVFQGSGSRQSLTGSLTGFNPSVEDFMVEFIVANNAQTNSAILGRRTSATGWEVYSSGSSSNLSFYIGDNAGNSITIPIVSESFANGIAKYTAITFDRNTTASFYVNGILTTGIAIDTVSASLSSSNDFYIGSRYNSSLTASLSGNFHMLRLYNFGSGGLTFNPSSAIQYNYSHSVSNSIHPTLSPYLVENWNWISGSNLTGSVSGNILKVALSTYPLKYRSSQIVGNLFYTQGFGVITETSNPLYREIGSGTLANGCTINLKGFTRRSEMRFECFSPAGEQNYTMNPTARYDESDVDAILAGSSSYDYRYLDSIPYITEIGLYNDDNELMVIGKLAVPIPKMDDEDLTFCIKIDL